MKKEEEDPAKEIPFTSVYKYINLPRSGLMGLWLPKYPYFRNKTRMLHNKIGLS
jgi:hypothetical protein